LQQLAAIHRPGEICYSYASVVTWLGDGCLPVVEGIWVGVALGFGGKEGK